MDIFINIPKRSILKTQTIHKTSVDESRRMYTSVDELDECRQVTDECRRM